LDLTLQTGIIFLVVFVVFTTIMVRFAGVARLFLSFFLVVALIAGAQFILSAWMPWPYDIIGAVAVALLLWALPRVAVHDAAIVLGIGGLAAVLGLSMTPLVACVLLAALSVYDILSVYRTRHMVVLAGRMLQSGAVFGFLVPARLSGFFMRRTDAIASRSVMMLGSGDIGLPLVLATSAVSQSIAAAVMVAVASLIGISAMHWLFVHQERPAPMAALPPIAVSAILGYLLAILLGV
jgi:presenilin-like A22 family membrane protease